MKKLLSSALYRVSALLLVVFCLPGTLLLHVRAGSQSDPAPDTVFQGNITKTEPKEAGVEVKQSGVSVIGSITSERGYGVYAADSEVRVTGDVRGDDIGIMVADESRGSDIRVDGDVEGGVAGINVSRGNDVMTDHIPETMIDVDGDVSGSGIYNSTRWRAPVQSAGVIADIEGYFGLNVDGDVTGKTPDGSGMYLAFDTQEANADIRVDGTVAGAKSGITVWYPTDATDAKEHYERPQLTLWQIENEGDRFVTVEGNGGGDYDAIAGQILSEIDYIIRSAPLENGSIVINATPKGNDLVGKQGDAITVTITPDDGYVIDSVSGGKASIVLKDDGTYELLVPMGGGVDITAVLKAIEEGAKEVAVAAAPQMSATDTGSGNEAPEEKNVKSSGTKPEENTVIGSSTPNTVLENVLTKEEDATVLGIRRSARTGDRTFVWQMICTGMAIGMYLAAKRIRKLHS